MSEEKILVVDDDEASRDLVATVLRRDGYVISLAFNGEDALEKIPELQPSLVISDLNMPKINGLELHSTLKEKFPSIAFILMSGAEFSEDDLKIYDLTYFLKKPLRFEELRSVIAKVMTE